MSEKNNNSEKPQSKSQKARNNIFGGLVCCIIFVFITYGLYNAFFEFPIGRIIVYLCGFFTFIIFLVTVSCFFDLKEAKRIEKLEEDARREEIEFSAIDTNKRALRAEKLFKMNQKELMRYYDMNIAQTKFLSNLGIAMIICGIIIIVISCFTYMSLKFDMLILVVGNISGIIVDFLGAIFIKMYTQNLEAAIKFHSKFVDSNNLLLANSIANKIENEELREKTLSDISREIIAVGHSKSEWCSK